MNIAEIIQICKDRNELDFLFAITKHIAESDSIGDEYSYCKEYTSKQFNNAEKHIEPEEYKARGFKDRYCRWLEYGGIPIYELYLYQVGALKKESKAFDAASFREYCDFKNAPCNYTGEGWYDRCAWCKDNNGFIRKKDKDDNPF